ncbi:P-loop containing nucleoside triphosphate hydrolase protein [Kalaharituber pfeilii]|nr:P-loop containing nucleoside triphosphate hydrolase protein [Kalaharituber pfeilii]
MKESTEAWVHKIPRIEEALMNRAMARNIHITIKDWQIDSCGQVLATQDCIVNVRTGGGKTLCYRLPAIINLDQCILVIVPLLALMEDLVTSNKKWGINSCHICADTVRENPQLIGSIVGGNYQVVYMCPEFAHADNVDFQRIVGYRGNKQSIFKNQLGLIVVDECHLVYAWNEFRPKYVNIGLLYAFFRKVPIMVMSATLPPHIMAYIHRSLRLAKPASLIQMSVNRPNIYLCSRMIQKNKKTFEDLAFLIPNHLASTLDIPKTIVFVDSKPDVCKVTNFLISKLPAALRNRQDIVMDYSIIHSTERRSQVLDQFREDSEHRILVVTEAAAMGVDIPDVVRVVQWGLTSWVNMLTLWQRLGRMGRDPRIQAVGIIFYTKPLLVKATENSPFIGARLSAEHEDAKQALDMAIASDMGQLKETMNGLCNRSHEQFTKKDPRLNQSFGSLWAINTTGCLRKAFMKYFACESELLNAATCCD